MAQANIYETYMLQLVNRARADPLAEAARYGIDLNQGLATGTLNGTAKQALASNDLLVDAARAHSSWMLDVDQFSHTGVGGSSPGDRMTSAGYSFSGSWTWGENIAWSGTTGALGDLAAYVEQQHEGLFRSPGHRVNILKGEFRELGIGQVTGLFTDPPSTYNASMITQAFATTGTSRFLTGVVYQDFDGDSFYDPGEGRAGVAISIGGAVLGTTTSAGAYSIALGDGSHAVSFSGGGMSGTYATNVTLAGSNVQLNAKATQFVAPGSAPALSVRDVTVSQPGQSVSAASLFGAIDPDGDPITFEVVDLTPDPASGHWVLNNVVRAANEPLTVAAADLGTLRFVAGSVSDTIQVRASDAHHVGAWAGVLVIVPPVAEISADLDVNESQVRLGFTVTLDRAPTTTVSVTWSVVDGTATVAAGDMPAGQTGRVLTFTPLGPLSQSFTVLVNDEADALEAVENFQVQLSAGTDVRLGRAVATVTLRDDHVPPGATPLLMGNTTTGQTTPVVMSAYTGPVSYLASEFAYLGGDSVSLVASAPNVFLKSGSGTDALRVTAGQNVLDAGTGSNFLTGGIGADTFFLDARGATEAIWSTVVGLGAGDAVTVWGVSQASASFVWEEGRGAPGFEGLTVHATPGGGTTASLTLSGFGDADRTNGRLSILFGYDAGSGSDYMYVFANS